MNLNKNSNLAILYRWFYSTDTMPDNLCTYFWSLVALVLLIIPSFIVSLPYIIVALFSKDTENTNEPIVGFFIWAFIGCLFSMGSAISLFFVSYEKESLMGIASAMGVGLFVGLGVIGIIYFFRKIKDKRKSKERSNLIKEFIRAKKNKYCPRIDWD